MHIEAYGYDPNAFGKDRTFKFEKAVETWIKASNGSREWLYIRRNKAKRLFVPFFKGRDIRQIQSIHIQEFYSHLQGLGYQPSYIKATLAELKTFFRFFRKSLKEIPEFPGVQCQEPVINWLDKAGQDAVFQHIKPVDLPIFIFMRVYGCRPNEALGLQWNNVFLNTPHPYVVLAAVRSQFGDLRAYTKTKRVKILPITAETAWLFANPCQGYVFTYKGKPYRHHQLNTRWNKAVKKAGVKPIRLYNGVRHSWAMQRLNGGFSLNEVQAVLGHTDPKMTGRYAKYLPEKLTDVIRGVYISYMPESEVKLLENKGDSQEASYKNLIEKKRGV
jgi:integrase